MIFKLTFKLILLIAFLNCILCKNILVGSSNSNNNIIYILPFSKNPLYFNNPNYLHLYKHLKDKPLLEYDIKIAPDTSSFENAAYIIMYNSHKDIINKPGFKKVPKEKRVLFLWEPPIKDAYFYDRDFHNNFGRVYTWDDSLVDNKNYFKFYYDHLENMDNALVPFEHRKLCCLFSSHRSQKTFHPNDLLPERINVIKFFEQYNGNDFSLYGAGWNSYNFKNYKGRVASKLDALKHYKFNYCYENIQKIDGYITEKIFDCFKVGCIPIYWGAQNITDFIPKNCFIDRRDFANNQELYNFIKSMKKEDYEQYLYNIQAYLASDKALLYSKENFLHISISFLMPSYNVNFMFNENERGILKRLYDNASSTSKCITK